MQLNTTCLYGFGKDCNDIFKRFNSPLGKRPWSGRLGELKLAAL
jgi:hypothetical protein